MSDFCFASNVNLSVLQNTLLEQKKYLKDVEPQYLTANTINIKHNGLI